MAEAESTFALQAWERLSGTRKMPAGQPLPPRALRRVFFRYRRKSSDGAILKRHSHASSARKSNWSAAMPSLLNVWRAGPSKRRRIACPPVARSF
jgi:hypothetical protein